MLYKFIFCQESILQNKQNKTVKCCILIQVRLKTIKHHRLTKYCLHIFCLFVLKLLKTEKLILTAVHMSDLNLPSCRQAADVTFISSDGLNNALYWSNIMLRVTGLNQIITLSSSPAFIRCFASTNIGSSCAPGKIHSRISFCRYTKKKSDKYPLSCLSPRRTTSRLIYL